MTLALTALVGACTPTIGVPVAADAADPLCARVVLSLPDELGDAPGLAKLRTNSQATVAWGEPGAAVTLRCGVEPPGPNTSCQAVESGSGTVDWIVLTDEAGTWTFVTYGRDPAVEVQVPPAVAENRSTSFVADINEAVLAVPQERACT